MGPRAQRYVDRARATQPPLPLDMPPSMPVGRLLSGREHQIAVLVANGFSNKEVALALSISPWTVSAHLRRVFTKLDISKRIELCMLLMSASGGAPLGDRSPM